MYTYIKMKVTLPFEKLRNVATHNATGNSFKSSTHACFSVLHGSADFQWQDLVELHLFFTREERVYVLVFFFMFPFFPGDPVTKITQYTCSDDSDVLKHMHTYAQVSEQFSDINFNFKNNIYKNKKKQ